MEPIQIRINRPGYLILNWSQARMAEIPTIELDPITQREMELHPPTVVSSRHMSPPREPTLRPNGPPLTPNVSRGNQGGRRLGGASESRRNQRVWVEPPSMHCGSNQFCGGGKALKYKKTTKYSKRKKKGKTRKMRNL